MRRYIRIASLVERCLFAAAVVCLGVFAAASVHRAVLSQFAMRELERPPRAAAPDIVSHVCELEDQDFVDPKVWTENRVRSYLAGILLHKRSPLAVLRIRSRNVAAPVFEGTDSLTLNSGVGRIAGHRDSFFYGLKDTGPGDIIELCTRDRTTMYTVDRTEIVNPDAVSVLGTRAVPSMTLVTCYPFNFVGNAPKRFIVHATLRSQRGRQVCGRCASQQDT
jgi:sortase A